MIDCPEVRGSYDSFHVDSDGNCGFQSIKNLVDGLEDSADEMRASTFKRIEASSPEIRISHMNVYMSAAVTAGKHSTQHWVDFVEKHSASHVLITATNEKGRSDDAPQFGWDDVASVVETAEFKHAANMYRTDMKARCYVGLGELVICADIYKRRLVIWEHDKSKKTARLFCRHTPADAGEGLPVLHVLFVGGIPANWYPLLVNEGEAHAASATLDTESPDARLVGDQLACYSFA